MIPLKDGANVRGARSGGITAHLSGPHLIPNVGREAMLGAEVVRRKPKAKPKTQPRPEKPPQPQTNKPTVEVANKTKRRRSPLRDRSLPRRSRSKSSPSQSRGQSRGAGRNDEHERSRSPLPLSGSRRQAADVDDTMWQQQQSEAQEREERRLLEERRQLQMLEEEKKRRKQKEIERNKKLAGFFSLTEDDLEEENKPKALQEPAKERYPAQAALSSALEGRHSLSSTGSRPVSVRDDFEESAGASGFDKCWGKWDWNKKDDPGELARQFMKVTAAKRRGYAPSDSRGRSSRPARRRSSSSSRGRG